MSVTDTYVQNDVIYRVLENGNADANGTLFTNMFGANEIVNAMNRIQQRFLLETGMIVTRAPDLAGVPSQEVYPLPIDSIRPRRITWSYGTGSGPTLVTNALTQADTWEMDNGYAAWPADGNPPLVWWENTLDQQLFGIGPSPNTTGILNILYVALGTALTGLGVAFVVPDDWTPYITWGTLGELLSSDGPAFDPTRAQYCSRRLDEGIELANLVLGGGS